jgi:formate/nitrite transporter
MIKTLVIVYFSNMVGAVIISALVYFSGLLDYTNGALGAYTIKVAYGKATITPFKAICSGILCNILVCIAVLMATAAKDIAGKVWAIFFPICAFVIGGWEHCVANMFYIPAGIIASMNDTYVSKAEELYGITAAQISSNLNIGGFISNLVPVTVGNILGGMVFVSLPLYVIHKSKALNNTN